jgi:hypothetical protein
LLPVVVDWQEKNGYRMTFLAEASLDLADDAELLRLMIDANFSTVFVGIETPNEASLRETKKLQLSDRERYLACAKLCREGARAVSLATDKHKLEEMALHYEALADAMVIPPSSIPAPRRRS